MVKKMILELKNLEWMTHKQNIQHAFDTGLIKRIPKNGKSVELLDENNCVIYTFITLGDAGKHVALKWWPVA
jgi:hypothetical protein